MKTLTLTLTEQQLQVIVNLIGAAGKSTTTGLDGVMQAATAIAWIQQAIAASNPQAANDIATAPISGEVIEPKPKRKGNGASSHA